MRLWSLTLTGTPEISTQALVLATDSEEASSAVLASIEDGWQESPQEITEIDEVTAPPQVLDLDMPDPSVECTPVPDASGPVLWRVHHNDGLFHRSPGASLVAADSAIDALRIVLAADPFEGQPPYGVPPAYGPVERFQPKRPYVVWVRYDNRES